MWQFLIPAAATLIGARSNAKAATEAANTTAAAADRASEAQERMFERQVQLQEPWRQAGETALNKLVPMATEYTPFGMEQFQADPGYAFRMAEGMKALERSAAARGGLLSGNMLKGIQRYGQNLASDEYTNAFNRYQTERNAQLAPLQSLAGLGQTTAQQIGAAGVGFANRIGDIGMNQANIAANAGLSRASTYGNALNQLANLGGRYLGGLNNTNVPGGSAWGMDLGR